MNSLLFRGIGLSYKCSHHARKKKKTPNVIKVGDPLSARCRVYTTHENTLLLEKFSGTVKPEGE